VLDHDAMLKQVQQLAQHGTITSASGSTLHLKVDSLCVHGDNDTGIAAIKSIRQLMEKPSARKA